MSAQLFEYFTLLSNTLLLVFFLFYFLDLRGKEKKLQKKEQKTDTNYHEIVDDALSKERKILEDANAEYDHILKDATNEADHIIKDAKYVSTSSQKAIDEALQKMIKDMEKQSVETAQAFLKSFQTSLQALSLQSTNDVRTVIHGLETDLKKQTEEFHQSLLPALSDEIEKYKQIRLKEIDKQVTVIIQKASAEILHKTITLSDHQNMVIESLEKAKTEGVFET